jgi:hypothetical protein
VKSVRIRIFRIVDGLDDPGTATLVLGAAAAIYAALVLTIGRGETIFVDEKSYFYFDRGFDAFTLFSPLNGHLVLGPRLIYALVFDRFGADFVPVQVLQAIGGALTAALLFVFARKRVGGLVALAMSLVVLFLGSAWEVTFIESGISNTWSLAAGIGALIALDRSYRFGDVAACTLLVVSLAFISFGLAFAVGAFVLILFSPRRWQRLWIVAVPILLYLAWYAWRQLSYAPEYGPQAGLRAENILPLPSYIAEQAAAVGGALSGLDYDFVNPQDVAVFETHSAFGPLIALIAGAALVMRLRRGAVTPMLWATLAALAFGWVTLGLAADVDRTPTTVRYVYASAVLVFLVAAEAARGINLRSPGKAAILAIAAIAILGNVGRLREGAQYYRHFSTELRAQLTAIELARDRVDPAFAPATGPAAFHQIVAGEYLAAVDRVGSLAFSSGDIADQDEGTRASLDATSVGALRIAAVPARGVPTRDNCRELAPGETAATPIPVPGAILDSESSAQLGIRRFADEATVPLGELKARTDTEIPLPADRSSQPWSLVASGASAPIRVCDLRPAAP